MRSVRSLLCLLAVAAPGCDAVPSAQLGDSPAEPAVVRSPDQNDPETPQAPRLRQLFLAMYLNADRTRLGRMVPEGAESWRVALARETRTYDPDLLNEGDGMTSLLLVTGPGTFFDAANPRSGLRSTLDQAPRSVSTIPLVIVVGPDLAVPVDAARDFVFDPSNPKAGLGDVGETIWVLMADGGVRKFPESISPAAFTVLCQIEPLVDEKTFAQIVPELARLGLPTVLPRRPKSLREDCGD